MLLLLLYACSSAVGSPQLTDGPVFDGRCDASAFVVLDDRHILVADDEKKSLGLYAITGGAPVKVKVTDHLGVDDETDLEGATMIGDMAYFIGSHGRTSKAKAAPARQVLFALERGETTVFVGRTFNGLQRALFELPDVGSTLAAAAKRAPKSLDGGLNIEGLAATPEGQLLIGFRNPLVDGKAIVVTLSNPSEVLRGKPPVVTAETVDLGGRGIRSFEGYEGGYLIVAGPVDSESAFAIYRWDRDIAIDLAFDLADLNPEAIGRVGDRILVLSDDGTRAVGGVRCKDAPTSQKSFRSAWITI